MTTEEKNADAYRAMTDSTRDLLRVPNNYRQQQRVKPEPETHPLAQLDFEKEPIRWRAAVAGY